MYKFFQPNKIFTITSRAPKYVLFLFIIVLTIGLTEALFLSPEDYKQSHSVRIMYVHVPSAWISLGIFSSIAFLSLGSFIFKNKNFSLISKSFRVEWFVSKEDFSRHLLGGILIGIGGVLSLGCTIGQGVSGVSTLALGSFITLISIILGATIAMKIEYYNAIYEDCSFFDSLRASLADLNLIPNKFRALDKI